MSRWMGFGVGVLALCAAGLSLGPAVVKAREGRRVEIFRSGGAQLGVVLKDVEAGDVASLKLAEERGAVVKEVKADSAAQKAGLKAGDVILRYQGEGVQSVAQLVRLVRETPPGRKVTIEISRDGAAQKLAATLDEPKHDRLLADGDLGDLDDLDFDVHIPPIPPIPALPRMGGKDHVFREVIRERGPRKLGIEYQELSGQLAKYFKTPENTGVLVSEVDEDGPAGKAGVKAGDVLLKVNGKAVRDGGELRDEVERLTPGQEATLTLQRDGKPLELKLKVGGRSERRGRGGDTT